jgi:hypothetical protein
MIENLFYKVYLLLYVHIIKCIWTGLLLHSMHPIPQEQILGIRTWCLNKKSHCLFTEISVEIVS